MGSCLLLPTSPRRGYPSVAVSCSRVAIQRCTGKTSTWTIASRRAWTAPAAPCIAAACARRDQARRAATRLADLRVAPQADSGWPYNVRCNSNPNLNPCPVAPVGPAPQTYRVGAGGSRLELLLLTLCQKVSIRGRPGNGPTQGIQLGIPISRVEEVGRVGRQGGKGKAVVFLK